MPEGDAVRRTARRLDEALAGDVLVRADLRVPRFATVDLRGMTVLGTAVRGKHLLTRLGDERRAWTLHHHLRMDGQWRIGRPGRPSAPAHQIRVWLGTATAQALGVRVHDVAVLPTSQEHTWVGHLGPDLMADDFDAAAGAAVLGLADRPLIEALLDQRLICGMGTMWAAELAWTAGVDPRASTASAPDLTAALEAIRRRMLSALTEPKLAQRRELAVFERTGQPCRRCGTPIRATTVGVPPQQRPTYWCPRCQPPS